MNYTVKQLADLSGVSTRTLRYYDEFDLLKPAFINGSGYRIYERYQVEKLKIILFYRSVGLSLKEIKTLTMNKDVDLNKLLKTHRDKLIAQRNNIDRLLQIINRMIEQDKGEIGMENKETFEVFKEQIIKENLEHYEDELKQKYPQSLLDSSANHFKKMSLSDYDEMSKIEEQLIDSLQGTKVGDNKQIYELHKRWLSYSIPTLTSQIHRGIADMYVQDKRFSKYYDDRAGVGATTKLRDAVFQYTIQ